MTRSGCRWATLLVCSILSVGSALANTIIVNNPSFETLPAGGLPIGCGTGCFFSEAAIPSWTSTGSGLSGQFQPGTQDSDFTYFNSLSDGITSAYSNGGTISQTVTDTVQLGVMYTLQVDLGYRNDVPFDATADLLINGATYLASGSTPVRGNWSTFTATYTGLASDVGKAITIQLISSGQQGNFDNVRLSDNLTSVPEPTLAGILGVGFAGFVAFRRRKRAC